jgi:WD40 repeat protein
VSYDAFISYSHSADGRLAPALQRGLQRLARPWYRPRALRVFRDETGLAVNPHLWTSIEQALVDSEWFILLCAPESAGSDWVAKEIERWLESKSCERILPVLTDGELAWDDDRGDFSDASNAVPPLLRGRFAEEPRFLDLRWARDENQLDLNHPEFRAAIAELAAPIHGVDKDELESEDVRLARRARRLARGAAALLGVLAVTALIASGFAYANQRRADREADRARASAREADAAARQAKSRELAASARNVVADNPARALLMAVEGYDIHPELATTDALARVLNDLPAGIVRFLPAADPSGRDGVTTVVTSADGARAATVSESGGVRVWDVERGAVVDEFDGDDPTPLAFSADGTALAWTDGATTSVRNVEHASDGVSVDGAAAAAAFSPDGTRLAVVIDGQVRVVDIATGGDTDLGAPLPTGTRGERIAWSDDGAVVAVGGHDTLATTVTLRTLRADTGEPFGPELHGHDGAPFNILNQRTLVGLQFTGEPNARRLTSVASASSDASLIEWDAATGAAVRSVRGPAEVASQEEVLVAISPDLRTIATASNLDGLVRLRALDTGALVGEPRSGGIRYSPGLGGDQVATTTTKFGGPDGELVLTGATDGGVRVFGRDTGTPAVTRTPLPGTFIPNAAVTDTSPDGGTLVALTPSAVFIIDLDTGETAEVPLAAPTTPSSRVAVSSTGTVAITGEGTLTLVDPDTGETRTMTVPAGSPQDPVFSPDGRRVAVTTSEFTPVTSATRAQVTFADTEHARVLEPRPEPVDASLGPGRFVGDEYRTTVSTLTPNGDTVVDGIAFGVGDGTAHALDEPWSAATGPQVSADGSTGAAVTGDGLFAWRDGREITLLEERVDAQHWPFTVAPDGRQVASFLQGAVRVWDVETGQPVGSPRRIGAPDGPPALAITYTQTPGRIAVVRDSNGTPELVHVDVDPERLRDKACAIANRSFTRDEWDRTVGDLVPYRKTCG